MSGLISPNLGNQKLQRERDEAIIAQARLRNEWDEARVDAEGGWQAARAFQAERDEWKERAEVAEHKLEETRLANRALLEFRDANDRLRLELKEARVAVDLGVSFLLVAD